MRNALLIKPRVSTLLCLFFCFIYLFSFLLIVFLPIALWLRFLVDGFVILHFIYVMRRYVFYRHPLSVKRLWCDDQDNWNIQYRDAHVRSAELLHATIISRYFVFMSFHISSRFLPVIIPLALDSEKSENMRRLRRRLQSDVDRNPLLQSSD